MATRIVTLVVHVATEQVRIPVGRARVERVVASVLRGERVRNADVSVTFVSDRRMARLNREHLAHSGATDVISFGFAPVAAGRPLTGDVYIAPAVARRNAIAHGSGIREELLRLVVHGTLHVAGHDHPIDDARYDSVMWRKQERLLKRLLLSA
ncbi:MAG: rRNA maturation RNase YbeY [Gemmatimonadota bacterium]|nr:rRNA maturation RNase YbeY [Gemmatimonadota bacterium]